MSDDSKFPDPLYGMPNEAQRYINERSPSQIGRVVQARFEAAAGPMFAELDRYRERIVSGGLPIGNQFPDYQADLGATLSPIFQDFNDRFKELPTRLKNALLSLGEHGWYLDLEMPIPLLWKFQRALDNGNVCEVEIELTEYFEERLDEIEAAIVEAYPHRAHIIRPALAAHRRGEYAIAIPTLLAQTDGICKEAVDRYLFSSENKRPQVATHIDSIEGKVITAAILSPLREILPITASEKQRSEGFSELNRHLVLHGDSLDYGTKVNSLKAISLIHYVGGVFKDRSRKVEGRPEAASS